MEVIYRRALGGLEEDADKNVIAALVDAPTDALGGALGKTAVLHADKCMLKAANLVAAPWRPGAIPWYSAGAAGLRCASVDFLGGFVACEEPPVRQEAGYH